MYKVFIENRPIFFAEKGEVFSDAHFVDGKSIQSVFQDIYPLIGLIDRKKHIVITSTNPTKVFERVFDSFEKVDAAGGLVRRKNKVLFIKRNGSWDIPKGKVDAGESIEEAALREIEEECGISGMAINSPICKTYHTYNYKGVPSIKKTHWFTFDYEGPKATHVQQEEGITKAKWIEIGAFDRVKENTYGTILDVLDQYELICSLSKESE